MAEVGGMKLNVFYVFLAKAYCENQIYNIIERVFSEDFFTTLYLLSYLVINFVNMTRIPIFAFVLVPSYILFSLSFRHKVLLKALIISQLISAVL